MCKRFFTAIIIMLLLMAATPASAKGTVETSGDIGQFLLPAAALGATWWHNDGRGSYEFGEAYFSTMATTYFLKYAIDEDRPGPNDRDHSFPSGHAASAFAAAAYLERRYGWEYGIPAYAAASYVGWTRVEAKQHWWGDVVASAAIGYGMNWLFTDAYERNISIAPVVDDHSAMLTLRMPLQ